MTTSNVNSVLDWTRSKSSHTCVESSLIKKSILNSIKEYFDPGMEYMINEHISYYATFRRDEYQGTRICLRLL